MTLCAGDAWVAFATGALTGAVELLGRYRDEPFKIFRALLAWVYVLINGSVGALAAWILFESLDGQLDEVGQLQAAIGAGLGGAVIIRARVITARVGDQEVAIGPGYVVDQILGVLDEQIDRLRALARLKIVKEALKEVTLQTSFDKAHTHVSAMIYGSRQALPLVDQKSIAAEIREIKEQPTSDPDKIFAIGFLVLDFMGERFLKELAKNMEKLGTDEDEATSVEAERRSLERTKLVQETLVGRGFDDVVTAVQSRLKETEDPGMRQEIEAAITEIRGSEVDDATRAATLVFRLLDVAGESFVKQLFQD